MKTLVIKRSEWLKGEGAEKSYLIRKSDKKKCCIGFFGLSCGILPEELIGIRSPSVL